MPYPKHNKHFVINHVQAQNTYCMAVIFSATHAITLVTAGRHFGKNFAHWVIESQSGTFLRLNCIVPKKKGENTGTSDTYVHCVAKVYAVLPFYDVKYLCSGGRE